MQLLSQDESGFIAFNKEKNLDYIRKMFGTTEIFFCCSNTIGVF